MLEPIRPTNGLKIARASLEAEAAIHQLLRARYDYDAAVRAQLSPDRYARYRRLEAERPAHREFEKVDAFYHRHVDKHVSLEYQPVIVGLIKEARMYSDATTYHGPYDGLPGIVVGTEPVLEDLKRKTAHLTEGLAELREMACRRGLPEEYQQLLSDYFREVIRNNSNRIASIRRRLDRECTVGPAQDHEESARD